MLKLLSLYSSVGYVSAYTLSQCNTLGYCYYTHTCNHVLKILLLFYHNRGKICDLEKSKRELVGVFGRTGAGKSSLINAIIGEKDLLPSGDTSACTSVMIQVQANMESYPNDSKYIAEIEFIPAKVKLTCPCYT